MAFRDLTPRFCDLRKRLRSSSPPSRSSEENWQDRLLEEPSGSKALISKGRDQAAALSLPPVWVDLVDQIKENISVIKHHLKDLSKHHEDRLKIKFTEEDEITLDRKIEILTQEITKLFRTSENYLKRIATIGTSDGSELPYQERVVRLNVMRSLASSVQGLSREFRQTQKSFLEQLNRQSGMASSYIPDDETTPISLDGLAFTGEQETKMKEMNMRVQEREKEIIQIAQSINELAEIFKELSILVIEQGTILDRIDYNVEQALGQVTEGVKDVEKAEEHQKKARTTVCIIGLLIAIAILVVIFILRQ